MLTMGTFTLHLPFLSVLTVLIAVFIMPASESTFVVIFISVYSIY